MLAAIESAIAERLAPLRTTGIFTRALPNKPADWGVDLANGVITLAWAKDELQQPATTSQVIQRCNMVWRLDVRLKNLRDASGCWAVLNEITRLLLGFKPPHCDPLYLRSREFLGELEGIWVCEVTFVAPTWVVEDSGETAETPLTGVFVLDEFGGLDVGSAANL